MSFSLGEAMTPDEDKMDQLRELYELGLDWVCALETECGKRERQLEDLRQTEGKFRKVQGKLAEIREIMNNGSEDA